VATLVLQVRIVAGNDGGLMVEGVFEGLNGTALYWWRLPNLLYVLVVCRVDYLVQSSCMCGVELTARLLACLSNGVQATSGAY
jgi:hypothetical protein